MITIVSSIVGILRFGRKVLTIEMAQLIESTSDVVHLITA